MSERRSVGLVDYGAGNYTSVRNALLHVGAQVDPVRSAQDLERQTHVVLPGVGAFAACMRRLEAAGLVEPLRARLAERDRPFLGICVGMQLLAEIGREFEDCPGLGAIAGEVSRLPIEGDGLRLPHIGWNTVSFRDGGKAFEGLGDAPTFYFVHSFQLVPDDPEVIAATCEYGSEVTAAVRSGSVYGVQFHPEKSQQAGLGLLTNFLELAPC